VLWAVSDKARDRLARLDIPVPTFEDAEIPNYGQRDPAPKFQHALSPAESQKLVQVPVDFELQLFASEPDIINPIAMAWDEKGRLFVIETVDYPNEVPSFLYSIYGAKIEDVSTVPDAAQGIQRRISIEFPVENLFVRLASGKKIEKLSNELLLC